MTRSAPQRHRDHAIIEQVIAELKDGPLAHLPSGQYAANPAWLAHAVIATHPPPGAPPRPPGPPPPPPRGPPPPATPARRATLRRRTINVPARIASSAR